MWISCYSDCWAGGLQCFALFVRGCGWFGWFVGGGVCVLCFGVLLGLVLLLVWFGWLCVEFVVWWLHSGFWCLWGLLLVVVWVWGGWCV